jgi:hypothetical protein
MAVENLAQRHGLDGERRVFCAAHLVNLTTKAMLYGVQSKQAAVEKLLRGCDDTEFANDDEEDRYLEAAMEPLYSDHENEDDAFSSAHTTSRRKYGPFAKLHNIGVRLRQNAQLKKAFLDAQQPGRKPLTLASNISFCWSSDHAMAVRALELRGPIDELYSDRSLPAANNCPSLDDKLEPGEWKVVAAFQQLLEEFKEINERLEGLSASPQSQSSGVSDYYPLVKILLSHLE